MITHHYTAPRMNYLSVFISYSVKRVRTHLITYTVALYARAPNALRGAFYLYCAILFVNHQPAAMLVLNSLHSRIMIGLHAPGCVACSGRAHAIRWLLRAITMLSLNASHRWSCSLHTRTCARSRTCYECLTLVSCPHRGALLRHAHTHAQNAFHRAPLYTLAPA